LLLLQTRSGRGGRKKRRRWALPLENGFPPLISERKGNVEIKPQKRTLLTGKKEQNKSPSFLIEEGGTGWGREKKRLQSGEIPQKWERGIVKNTKSQSQIQSSKKGSVSSRERGRQVFIGGRCVKFQKPQDAISLIEQAASPLLHSFIKEQRGGQE